MNLSEFFSSITIDDLHLREDVVHTLRGQGLTDCLELYEIVRSYRTANGPGIEGLGKSEMRTISYQFSALLLEMGQQKSDRRRSMEAFPVLRHQAAAVSEPDRPAARKPRSTGTTSDPDRSRPKPSSPPRRQPGRAPLPDPMITALQAWEQRLLPEVQKVELIGEIEITEAELIDLSHLLAELFSLTTEPGFHQLMEETFPATFLVFMAGIGIFGYEGGDFWTAYRNALKSNMDQSAFGRLFETNLQKFRKPLFRDLQERSMRFVSLILAHGGIPIYCLKDFFSNIVLNSCQRPQLILLEGEELVEEILKHPAYTAATDKPVLNFLEFGGVTAANLLNRSRKMLNAWQQQQTLLSAEEAGLPQHITNYFREWTHEHGTLPSHSLTRHRLKRPHLSVDPWGLGVFLTLPSQPVTTRDSGNLAWRVQTDTSRQDLPARTQRKGDRLETREISLRLNEITSRITLEFVQGENTFDWNLSGYSDEHRILAFDPVSGHAQNHLRAQETWLLLPGDLTLSITAGSGRILEVLPELPGVWSRFKLEAWDLSQASRIALLQGDTQVCEIYVRGQESFDLPVLEGGNILPTDLEENPLPVYSGCPPILRIPMESSENRQIELKRWEIRIRNIMPSYPELTYQETLDNLTDMELTSDERAVQVHLSAKTLLTTRPAGAYRLEIQGPLGRDTEMSFYILPDCEITGLQDLYLPDPRQGPQPVSFLLNTSLLSGVDSLDPAQEIGIACLQPGKHQISVPPENSVVRLLVRQENIEQFIQVPLHLRINRVRWRMVDDQGHTEDWCQEPVALSLQQLVQEQTPLLLVDLPGNQDGRLHLALTLSDLHGNLVQQLEADRRSGTRASRFWRFDLSRIKHSMESSDSPIFRVHLVITDRNDEAFKQILPVLVFTLDIQLLQLETTVQTDGEIYSLQLHWVEQKPLQARALILWSLFRPWQPPLLENIPDAAVGEHAFCFPVDHHWGGLYRMQMVILDPWAPSPPPPLPPESPVFFSHDIAVSSPQDRLQELESNAPRSSRSEFSRRLESALIRQHLGQAAEAIEDLQACCRSLQSIPSREILTLQSLLAQNSCEPLQAALGHQVMQPEVLKPLIQDQKSGAVTAQEFAALLESLPERESWPGESCAILAQLEDPRIQFLALQQMLRVDSAQAVHRIIDLVQRSALSTEDAVDLLYEEYASVTAHLQKRSSEQIAGKLLDLLERYDPYSGLPVIHVGSWVQTSAGWGRIDEILDPHTRVSVDSFMEGDGQYILPMTMHIYESADLTGEKAILNMTKMELTFPRAQRIFRCQHCQQFSTAKLDLFKTHLLRHHGNALLTPGERGSTIPVSRIEFNMDPKQKREE